MNSSDAWPIYGLTVFQPKFNQHLDTFTFVIQFFCLLYLNYISLKSINQVD